MRRLALCLALLGCTPSHIQVRRAPNDAIDAAVARLEARGVSFDAAGRRANRARSAHYCYRPPRRDGGGFDASFKHPAPGGPVGFEHTATLDEQAPARDRCAHLFRFELVATPHDGESRVEIEAAWWRVRDAGCTPVGDPLLGALRCTYAYRASHAPPADLPRFVYRVLAGL